MSEFFFFPLSGRPREERRPSPLSLLLPLHLTHPATGGRRLSASCRSSALILAGIQEARARAQRGFSCPFKEETREGKVPLSTWFFQKRFKPSSLGVKVKQRQRGRMNGGGLSQSKAVMCV